MAGQGLQDGNIDWREMGIRDGSSPVESFDVDNAGCTRKFKVPWNDRFEFVWRCLGGAVVQNSSISRYLPEVHPQYQWLVATRIPRVSGLGWVGKRMITGTSPNSYIDVVDQPINEFTWAQIEVEYTFPEYEIIPDDDIEYEHDRYVIERPRQSAKYLTFPNGAFRWAAGTPSAKGVVVGNNGKIEVTTDYELTWKMVPQEAVPVDLIDDYCGCINSTEFRGKPPGTMLMLSGQRVPIRLPYGIRAYDVVYAFKYFKHGHDKIYDFNAKPATDRGYYQISTDGAAYGLATATDGRLTYDVRDFNLLFGPG